MVPLFRPRSFSGTAGAKPQVLFFGGAGGRWIRGLQAKNADGTM